MDYYTPVYAYLIGVIVLIGIQFLNLIAIFLNIPTWYNILLAAMQQDISIPFSSLSIYAILYLFLVYPLVLGVLAYVISKIFIT